MEQNDRKNEILKAASGVEFSLVTDVDPSTIKEYKKIPMTEISGLAAMFSEIVPKFRTVTTTTKVNAEGLYRCTFPNGISGELAKFHDGTGNLGTIMNNGKIVGQARWNPVNAIDAVQTMTVPIRPIDLFMAAAIIQINHKLDKIQKTGEEILNYQKEKDRAILEANFDALIDTYNKLQYNLNDEKWLQANLTDVKSIKRNTSSQIKHLRSQIYQAMDKHDLVHNDFQTKSMFQKVQDNFKQYRMAVYMYAFATFLGVLLQGNFAKDYLEAICNDIDKITLNYKEFYTECYNRLEHSSKTTVESKFISGLAKATKDAGQAIHKIPVIEKGPLDEALISAGNSVENLDNNKTVNGLQKFTTNMTNGATQFEDAIQEISRLYNDPMDILIDNDNVYLKLEKTV